MNPREQAPKFELGPQAREVIDLFQQARRAVAKEERQPLLERFRTKLVELLTPPGEEGNNRNAREQYIPKNLLEDNPHPGEIALGLGGATGGQRIFFRNYIAIFKNEPGRAEKLGLGKGAVKDGDGEEFFLSSADGKIRWMMYPFPEGSDYKWGKKYWERFMEAFGDQIVDLLQDLKENDK